MTRSLSIHFGASALGRWGIVLCLVVLLAHASLLTAHAAGGMVYITAPIVACKSNWLTASTTIAATNLVIAITVQSAIDAAGPWITISAPTNRLDASRGLLLCAALWTTNRNQFLRFGWHKVN